MEQLAAHFDRYTDGASGNLITGIFFRNVSHTSCALRGYPREVEAVDPGRPVVVGTNGSYFPSRSAPAMPPGGLNELGLATHGCRANSAGLEPGRPYHRFAVSVPGGVIIV